MTDERADAPRRTDADENEDEKVLREQQLVNERESEPGRFGGKPLHEPRETPIEDIEPRKGEKRDIQTGGA